MNHPTTVAGIPLPSDTPWFLAIVAVHVAAGIVAVIAGLVAMGSGKVAGRHPRSGTVYFWALGLVSLTMTIVVVWRWPVDNALGVLGLIAFVTAVVGRRARRRARKGWRCVHVPCMGTSYIALLTAFYVDNGSHLPLWNRLPPLAFWLLPAAVGVPLTVLAWVRYCPFPRRGHPDRLLDPAT